MASSSAVETPTTTDPPLKRRRRWLFSIKIFLAVNALVFAIGAGTVYWRISRFEAAKREVERFGGKFVAAVKVPNFIPKWARWKWVETFYSQATVIQLSWATGSTQGFTNESLKIVAAFPTIETLDLGNASITDAGLVVLENLPNLVHLDLSGTQVTDAGVKFLEGHLQLKGLGLSRTEITDVALESVQKLPKVEWLALDDCPNITDQGIQSLRSLPMTCLFITSPQVTDASLSVVLQFPRLSHLSFDADRLSVSALNQLKSIESLESVEISEEGSGNDCLQSISEISSLKYLHLKNCSLGEAGTRQLHAITNLRWLTFENVQLTEGSVERIAEQNTLIMLSFRQTRIADQDLETLAPLAPTLATLNLINSGVTDSGLAHIRKFARLTTLRIGGDEFTDAGIEHLKGMKSLVRLDLRSTNITDACVPALRTLTALTHLSIDGTQLTENGETKLKQALPKLTIQKR